MKTYDLFFVFDVESIGLHGEGFALGYVVIDRKGTELEAGRYSCLPNVARGSADGHKWVNDHVPTMEPTHHCVGNVRAAFWRSWIGWKERGAVLAADCAWPVEARFLAACVDDHPMAREWAGPYPLVEISSVRLAKGLDPLGTEKRSMEEMPEHHPLSDARQSARLLIEAFNA